MPKKGDRLEFEVVAVGPGKLVILKPIATAQAGQATPNDSAEGPFAVMWGS